MGKFELLSYRERELLDMRGQFKYVTDNSYIHSIDTYGNHTIRLAGTMYEPHKGLVLVVSKPMLCWVQTLNFEPKQELMSLVYHDKCFYMVLSGALSNFPV